MSSMFFITEIIVRLSSGEHSAEFYLDHDENYARIFADAHANVDGTIPSHTEIGMVRWLAATRLRIAENELRAKLGKELLPL